LETGDIIRELKFDRAEIGLDLDRAIPLDTASLAFDRRAQQCRGTHTH
jgi:hypothetical protein